MKNRQPMPKKASQKLFTKTASSTHPRNTTTYVMRGGTRL